MLHINNAMLYVILILVSITYARDTVLVSTDTWPPFRIGNTPAMTGIDIDILKELEKELNVAFIVNQAPWVRCLDLMKNGQTDVMIGLAKTSEREEYISYSKQPYYSCSPAFFVRKGSKVVINTYNDLKKITIGYARASAYFESFDSDISLQKVDIADETTLIKMLLSDRVQAIVGTDCQVAFDLKIHGWSKSIERTAYKPNAQTYLYIGISKKSPFITRINDLNRAVDRLIANKRPQTIASKYFK